MGSVIVFGSINRDLVVTAARLPKPGQTVCGFTFKEFPGGKGANQAVASARMGANTALVGAIGLDANGAAMRAFLEDEGIGLRALVALPDVATGVALISVDAVAENTIIVVPGANAHVKAVMLATCTLRAGDCLLAQFEVPLVETLAAFRFAREAGAFTMLNPAPMQAVPARLLALTDFLVLNQTELADIAQSEPVGDLATAQAAMHAIRTRQGGRLMVIATLGANGCVAIGPHGEIRLPGETVAAVDTTGAGDCFTGTLAAGLAQAMPFEAALKRANRAAAISVTRPGAASSMPYLREL